MPNLKPNHPYLLSTGHTGATVTITSGSTLSDNLQGTTVAMQNLTDILEGPNPHRSGACGNPECEQGYDKGYSDGQADLISELEELE